MRSLVGVNLFFAAVHQLCDSFCELDGEGGLGIVCDREGGGGRLLVLPIIARTLSSTRLRSSASLVKIRSASRRLLSRSRSASASSSASDSIEPDMGDRGAIDPKKVPTRSLRLEARFETEEEGEGDRSCQLCGSSSSSSSSEAMS